MAIAGYLEQPIIKTAGGVIVLDALNEAGSLIVIAGAVATILRLPPLVSPEQDHRFVILNTVDQNLTILPPLTAGYVGASLTLGAFNNLNAASLAYTTASSKIGAICSCRSYAGKWWITNSSAAVPTIT